jgi:hypothetical protein
MRLNCRRQQQAQNNARRMKRSLMTTRPTHHKAKGKFANKKEQKFTRKKEKRK